VNLWAWGALVLLAGVVPCGSVLLRGQFLNRLVAVELASVLVVQALLLLTVAYGHDYLVDVALALAVLAFPGTILFAHFMEFWR
jgi:multicomponent Na+:H+ antiporter subunit F